MLRKRARFEDKGISEIVGTLMVLVATIAIAGMMVAIATNSIQVGVLNQQNQATLYSQQLQERFIAYDVYFHTVSSTPRIQLEVYNYGLVYVNIVSLYANLSGSEAPVSAFSTPYPVGFNLSPGQTGNISIPFSYTRGSHYDLILVSSDGTKSESLWSA